MVSDFPSLVKCLLFAIKTEIPFIQIRCKVNCKACILVYWQMKEIELHSFKTYEIWKISKCQKMSCLLVSHLKRLLNFDFKINVLWYALVKTDACLQGLELKKLWPCISGKPNIPYFSYQKTKKFQVTKWSNNCDISFARLVWQIKKSNENYFRAK